MLKIRQMLLPTSGLNSIGWLCLSFAARVLGLAALLVLGGLSCLTSVIATARPSALALMLLLLSLWRSTS